MRKQAHTKDAKEGGMREQNALFVTMAKNVSYGKGAMAPERTWWGLEASEQKNMRVYRSYLCRYAFTSWG